MVKISLNMVHIIKRSYEITVVCLPLTTSAEQFNIFLRRKFTENLSLRTFQQKGPQKLCHLIFLKVVKKENYCDIWLPTPNSMSGIFLVLELSLELLSIDHLQKFKKSNISKMNCVIKLDFLHVGDKSIGLGLA